MADNDIMKGGAIIGKVAVMLKNRSRGYRPGDRIGKDETDERSRIATLFQGSDCG